MTVTEQPATEHSLLELRHTGSVANALRRGHGHLPQLRLTEPQQCRMPHEVKPRSPASPMPVVRCGFGAAYRCFQPALRLCSL